MVFLRKKLIKGKPYWYIVEAARVVPLQKILKNI